MSQFDSDYEDELFECADAGAAGTFPKPAGDLKKGELVLIRSRPCKVLDLHTAKPGKHGATKVSIEGADIFTGKKCELVAPSGYPLPCPFLKKTEYLLIDIDDEGHLTLLDEDNEERSDLDLPASDHDEHLAGAIRAHFFKSNKSLILVSHQAMGIEQIVAFKFETCGK